MSFFLPVFLPAPAASQPYPHTADDRDAAQDLQFDFLEEVYDCHIRIAGRIYPGVIALYALSFIVSRPVRRLLWAARQHRKELAHG